MNVREMFPSKRFDAHDLRDFGSGEMIVVTIESIDFQSKDSKEVGVANVDWLMKVKELKKPIKFNSFSGYTLAEIFGTEESEEWVGRRIGIKPEVINGYGKPMLVVNFWDCGPQLPVLPDNTDLTGFRRWTTDQQERLKRRCLPAANAAPEEPGGSVSGQLAPAQAIGEQKAALIIVGLRERGLEWDNLVAHLKGKSLGSLIVGLEPGSCPQSIENHARAFLEAHPIATRFDDRQAEADKIIAGWRPPPTEAVAREVIDKATGEVKTAGAGIPPDDDIPF